MARIRSVYPDACTSETLARLTGNQERTFWRLLTHCDDQGRAVANPKLLKAALYPLHDTVSLEDLEADFQALAAAGLLFFYEAEGRRYLASTAWARYQHPKHPTPSKLPPPPSFPPSSPSPTPALTPSLSTERELEKELEKEEGGGVGGTVPGAPPQAEPVSEVVQTWNATAKALGLPQVLRVEGRRRDAIRARLREAGWLELFRQALEALATSPELAWARGAKPMGDGGVFRADLDFMLRPGKAVWMVERAGVPAGPGRAGLRSALHDAAESMKAQLRAQKQQSPNPNGDAHDLMPDLRSGADGSEFDLPPLPSRP